MSLYAGRTWLIPSRGLEIPDASTSPGLRPSLGVRIGHGASAPPVWRPIGQPPQPRSCRERRRLPIALPRRHPDCRKRILVPVWRPTRPDLPRETAIPTSWCMRRQMTNPGPAFPNTTSVTKFVKSAFSPYHTRKVVDEADWKDRCSLGPASNHFYFHQDRGRAWKRSKPSDSAKLSEPLPIFGTQTQFSACIDPIELFERRRP